MNHVDTETCWCDPEILVPCPQCLPRQSEGCWRCDGRGVIPYVVVRDGDCPVIVVHR